MVRMNFWHLHENARLCLREISPDFEAQAVLQIQTRVRKVKIWLNRPRSSWSVSLKLGVCTLELNLCQQSDRATVDFSGSFNPEYESQLSKSVKTREDQGPNRFLFS